MGHIVKIAVLHIIDKQLLLCRKKGVVELISLGGTLEDGEDYEDCARREVEEETGCGVVNLKYYDTFVGQRVDEPRSKITLICYFGDIQGTPEIQPRDKVYDFVWIDRDWNSKGYKFPTTLEKTVSKLISEDYL